MRFIKYAILGLPSGATTHHSKRRALHAHLPGLCPGAAAAVRHGQTGLHRRPHLAFVSAVCPAQIFLHGSVGSQRLINATIR